MRTRHRMPTLFTLSMLDVFCCALGCVILLWLWNDRLAKSRAQSAANTERELKSTLEDLTGARESISTLTAELSRLKSQVAAVTGERDQVRSELAEANRQMGALSRDRDKIRKELVSAQGDLASLLEKKRKDDAALKSQVSAAQKRVADIEMLMRDRDRQLTVASAKSKDLADQLHDLEGQLKMVRSKADAAGGLQSRLEDETRKLAAADARVRELEKNLVGRKSILVEMQGRLDELQSERKSLSDEMAKLRVAADNRFAGVQLTGRRVVFLVDMSGSMKMTDAKTDAPDKWPTVITTLVKVMKSLPDLEKFQVVMFGESIALPLGGTDEWLDFDPSLSPERTRESLTKIDPRGNTNMYAAFEQAFRFRARGLDTIYLFSDGIPNVGPGLSVADQTREMRESEKGEILGRYVRQVLRDNWNRPATGMAKVRINSIGFFYESPDLGAFLWALAREHDGSFVGMSKP